MVSIVNEILDINYARTNNLSAFAVHELIVAKYPELNRYENSSPWSEKIYKGRLVVVMQDRRRGMYRFSGHNYWVKSYAAKRTDGTWAFVQRLADFDLETIPTI